MDYQLYREQQLYCDVGTAWEFFSSPMNLALITPPEMRFTIHTDCSQQHIYDGMLIDYTLTPLWGIPLKWQTLISDVDPGRSFVDIQKRGPYAYWRHLHTFVPNEQGVMMYDTVDYALPFGRLGKLAHRILVKKKLESIFDFRKRVLTKLFAG